MGNKKAAARQPFFYIWMTLVWRVLKNNYPDLILDRPAFLRDVGAKELRLLNGMGKGCIEEIVGALEAEGLIGDRREWL